MSNEVRLYVEQRGAALSALVFLHYWGGSSQTWNKVAGALTSDFRTVTFDQRGWGRSEAPATGYELADLAADAERVIDQTGLDRYVLVGHSMGGKVAQLIASRRPPGLLGLVLIAPSPPSPLQLPTEAREAMVRAYISRESVIATVEQVLTHRRLEPEDLERVVADSLSGSLSAKEAWPMWASQEDISANVADIDVPTIVISGDRDRVDPTDVLREDLLPLIPQATLHVLPGVGHLSPLEAPKQVADLIRAFALPLSRDYAARLRSLQSAGVPRPRG